MHHAQKTIMRQFHQREALKTMPQQNRNFGGENRHGNINEQGEGRRSCQQAKNHHCPTNDFDHADKRTKKIRMQDADLRKASGPMYIAEIAPAAKRGRLVGLFQFNIVAGILIAYLSNYLIGTLGFGSEEWRWKLGVATLPALFFFLNLFGIPQSPRWLIRRGFVEEARGLCGM